MPVLSVTDAASPWGKAISWFDIGAAMLRVCQSVIVLPEKQNSLHIMKKQHWISMIALPLALVACQEKQTVKDKMDAGADKVAEGVK
jgi:hypothetical protein